MKTLKFIIVLIAVALSYSCKAQQQGGESSNYAEAIIGTWIADDDPNYKLIFFTDGTCKGYQNGEIFANYTYSIMSENCNEYNASNVKYLKWFNIELGESACLEIQKITANTLSLMIIDRGKILFFNKE